MLDYMITHSVGKIDVIRYMRQLCLIELDVNKW